MSAERDIGLDEKRVYGAKTGRRTAFVAAEAGLVRVDVSDDLVGAFGLARRGPATDAAADAGRLAVATSEDVFVAASGDDGIEFEAAGFGSATAVDFHDGLIAAGDGRVARYTGDRDTEGDGADADGGDAAAAWTTLSEIDGVRALDGGMVAATGGVFRLDGTHVGLADARDVAVGDAIYAATGDGLYWLANGWRPAIDGPVGMVACVGSDAAAGTASESGPSRRPAHAAGSDTFYERGDGIDAWHPVGAVDGRVTGVAYADASTYAVTGDGRFLANAGDESRGESDAEGGDGSGRGWRSRSLGIEDARAIVIVG